MLLDQSCQILVAPHSPGQALVDLLTSPAKVIHFVALLNQELDDQLIGVRSIRLYSYIGRIAQGQVGTVRGLVVVMGAAVDVGDSDPYLLT